MRCAWIDGFLFRDSRKTLALIETIQNLLRLAGRIHNNNLEVEHVRWTVLRGKRKRSRKNKTKP